MKYLKGFNEAVDSNLDIIKDYFVNIKDDLDDICTIDFTKVNSTYFQVDIEINPVPTIRGSNMEAINRFLERSKCHEKVLSEIKLSFTRLESDGMIESFEISNSVNLYRLCIHLHSKNKDDVDNWINIKDNGFLLFDERSLSQILKNKFNLTLKSYVFDEGDLHRLILSVDDLSNNTRISSSKIKEYFDSIFVNGEKIFTKTRIDQNRNKIVMNIREGLESPFDI